MPLTQKPLLSITAANARAAVPILRMAARARRRQARSSTTLAASRASVANPCAPVSFQISGAIRNADPPTITRTLPAECPIYRPNQSPQLRDVKEHCYGNARDSRGLLLDHSQDTFV